jgi:hypothetical protein
VCKCRKCNGKTLTVNPRICVMSPDFVVVDGATVLGGAAVVSEVGVAKSLKGVNTL